MFWVLYESEMKILGVEKFEKSIFPKVSGNGLGGLEALGVGFGACRNQILVENFWSELEIQHLNF